MSVLAYLVALLFLTFTDRLFWMLVAMSLTMPQIAGLSSPAAGARASLASAAARLVGRRARTGRPEDVPAPRPWSTAATRDRAAQPPTVFVTGSSCSGVAEARNALCTADEAMRGLLRLAPETTSGAELLALHRHTKLIWVYRDFRVISMRRSTAADPARRLERLLRQESSTDRRIAWIRRQADGHLGACDVAALAWYVKNSELFRLGLDCDARVLVLNDAILAAATRAEVAQLRAFVGLISTVPLAALPRDGGDRSEVGPEIPPLSGEVRELCEHLWSALEGLRESQRRDRTARAWATRPR